MGHLNYDIDIIVGYLQQTTPAMASIVQARAEARLTALSQSVDPSAFRVVGRSKNRLDIGGNIQSILNVIDDMEVADVADLQRIEAVMQYISEIGDEHSSSSSQSA